MGEGHAKTINENQDVVFHKKNERYTVISLADGTSSCKMAKKGAELACKGITELLLDKSDYFFTNEKEKIIETLLTHIIYLLDNEAKNNDIDIDEYSSTLTSVLYDRIEKKLLVFSVGDSAIFISGNGKCNLIMAPVDDYKGTYVTTTRDVSKKVFLDIFDKQKMDSLVICSDGAWTEMYDRNRLKPEVMDYLMNMEYEELKKYLVNKKCYDDYSFIAMDLNQLRIYS